MKTNCEKLTKINYEKLSVFYLPFTAWWFVEWNEGSAATVGAVDPKWNGAKHRSEAPESPTPTANGTPLPYRSNRHGRWGCAQRKKNKRQVYTELLLLATAFKAKYDYFCHGRRHHTMGIIKYKRAKNGNDEIVNIVY